MEGLPFSVVVRLRQEDHEQAVRAVLSPRWLRTLVLGLVAANAAMIAYVAVVHPPVPLALGVLGLVPLVMSAYVFLLQPWMTRRDARRQFSASPDGVLQSRLTVSSDVLMDDDDGSTQPWAGFQQARETAGHFLLHFTPRKLLVIPKRDLSAEQASALRRLLKERLKERAAVHVEN